MTEPKATSDHGLVLAYPRGRSRDSILWLDHLQQQDRTRFISDSELRWDSRHPLSLFKRLAALGRAGSVLTPFDSARTTRLLFLKLIHLVGPPIVVLELNLKFNELSWFETRVGRLLYPRARLITVLSPSDRSGLIKRLGVDPERVMVVNQWAQPGPFSESQTERVQAVLDRFGPRYAIAAGRSSRNYEELYRAVALVPGLRMVVIGSKSVPEALQNRVCALPRLGFSEYVFLLRRASFGVIPLWPVQHTCGIRVWFQSNALRVPVVISRTEPIDYYASSGAEARFYPPGDVEGLAREMSRLWHDPQACEALGVASEVALNRNFSAEAYHQTLIRLLAHPSGLGQTLGGAVELPHDIRASWNMPAVEGIESPINDWARELPARPARGIQRKAVETPLNVVHVFPYPPQMSGGHSNAIRGFIECQRAAGINATAVAPRGPATPAKADWKFPLAEFDSLWNMRWVTIAQRLNIEADNCILHFHVFNRRLLPLLRQLRQASIPYVFTSHGQLNFHGSLHWLMKVFYLNCVDLGPRKAAGLHLLTAAASRRLDYLLPGYRGPRLVQGNVIVRPDPRKLPAVARSDYGIPDDAFVFLFLGRLDVQVKALDLVVEAFARLPSRRFHLILAGPDWAGGKSRLEQMARRLGCANRIHWPGPVYDENKWALLRLADVFVSPSRWEAFGLAHVEAMASGLPLLTSNQISLAPDLRKAEAAILVHLEVEALTEAFATLAADRMLREGLASRGRAWVDQKCGLDNAGRQFHRFYEFILARRQGSTVRIGVSG